MHTIHYYSVFGIRTNTYPYVWFLEYKFLANSEWMVNVQTVSKMSLIRIAFVHTYPTVDNLFIDHLYLYNIFIVYRMMMKTNKHKKKKIYENLVLPFSLHFKYLFGLILCLSVKLCMRTYAYTMQNIFKRQFHRIFKFIIHF